MKKISFILLLMCFATGYAKSNTKVLDFESAANIFTKFDKDIQVIHTPIPVYTKDVAITRISLSGEWLFSTKPNVNFEDGSFDKGKWNKLRVPSEWNMEGYSVEGNAWAGYYKEFNLPADWQNKCIKIKFGTVQSECKVYVNGKYVDSHMGAMTAFELDITSYIYTNKTNSIAIYVKSNSISDEYAHISHYAKHQVGGILREVFLLAYSPLHISNITCDALLDSTLQAGTLKLDLELSKKKERSCYYVIRLKERGIEGLPCAQKSVLEVQTKEQSLNLSIKKPQLWHAESPFLYTLEIDLYYKGEKQETIRKNIGFRRIDIHNNSLFVNNKQVKLRGVARHDISPYFGRAIPDSAYLLRDIQLLRQGNCNFIRTSHYPADEYLMDLCDRYGIFVENEAPVCWDRDRDPKTNSVEHAEVLFYGFKSLIYRDRTHPSVLTWSIANESLWGARFYPCYLLAKKTTPHIPVKFSHSEFLGIVKLFDIGARHYPGWTGVLGHQNYFRPMIFSEALHVNCYNASENITDPGLRDLWGDCIYSFMNAMQESPAIAGLAIWSGIDEMFYPRNGKPCGYGPWGIWDGFRRAKPEFWHMKMAYSPIVVNSKHFIENNKVTMISLFNRYTYNTTDGVEMHWNDGYDKGIAYCSIEPSKEGILCIPHQMKGDTIELRAVDPRGFELAAWKLPRQYTPHYKMPELSKGEGVQIKETKTEYIIKTNNLAYYFSKENGILKQVLRNGIIVFKGTLNSYLITLQKKNETIDFIPVDTDNSSSTFASKPLDEWTFNKLVLSKAPYGVNVKVEGYYGTVKTELEYKIDGTNRLRIDYMFNLSKLSEKEKQLRQYGLGFDLPITYQNLSWQRKGLWTYYPDNHIGRNVGVAKAFYPETLTNYYAKRKTPTHSYNRDGNKYGSNDFRSTKHNIISASIYTDDNQKIVLESNGGQHIRTWVNGDKVSFILAHYSNGGNEHYLNFYSEMMRPLNFALHNNNLAGWMQIRF